MSTQLPSLSDGIILHASCAWHLPVLATLLQINKKLITVRSLRKNSLEIATTLSYLVHRTRVWSLCELSRFSSCERHYLASKFANRKCSQQRSLGQHQRRNRRAGQTSGLMNREASTSTPNLFPNPPPPPYGVCYLGPHLQEAILSGSNQTHGQKAQSTPATPPCAATVI